MKNKLEQVGKSIEQSLLKKVEENNRRIEEKLNLVMNHSKTYVETLKNIKVAEDKQSNSLETADFRAITKETRNEELAEVHDKKVRS